jgi:hypothetical protein
MGCGGSVEAGGPASAEPGFVVPAFFEAEKEAYTRCASRERTKPRLTPSARTAVCIMTRVALQGHGKFGAGASQGRHQVRELKCSCVSTAIPRVACYRHTVKILSPKTNTLLYPKRESTPRVGVQANPPTGRASRCSCSPGGKMAHPSERHQPPKLELDFIKTAYNHRVVLRSIPALMVLRT